VARSAQLPRSDRALGIETSRAVALESLALLGDNAIHAERYEPTPFPVLDDMLLELGLDYPRYTFVDLGSGKGRVLCLAARHPFRRIIGVELSPALDAIARDNLRALPASWKRCRDVSSQCGDAATFELPNEPLVVFMFNPFGPPVLARVVANLERSLAEHPRDVWVLYYMPVHAHVLARSHAFTSRTAAKDWQIFRSMV
jgi:SAM-dependent methyltransferase